ncbi:beta-lactamase family protein [Roseomonas terrae]|uniref:Beta-lactamase family protein n=1 Tax=Neoroseomonas terrae TaxID=424799 RepID=A0ABS5EL22_9PROT|nr:serine hydrolase domain-containing protein [Neoroseomonas terrae]MBR0651733.1 beta-lactamase family protein [Neoroseomonas terrae]
MPALPRLAALGLAVSLAFPAIAADLPRAQRAEDVGLSTERLSRIGEWLEGEVQRGAIPGAIVVIGRRGSIAYETVVGFRDREAQAPMGADAVFRIASMTKPIVSLAVMILAEEGRLSIADPIGRHLPEWRETPRVGEMVRNAEGTTAMVLVPARRPITVQDLLRHTSGITDASPGDHPVAAAYRESTVRARTNTMEEMSRKLAALPLLHQPGTTWEYSWSTDILGRLVEVVSGTDLDTFVRTRITGPLGMTDTGFMAPNAGAGRIAQPQNDPATGRRPAMPDPTDRPAWFSGAGGMVSTARDYARFTQFLLNKGELDGKRIASRHTIDLMAADHLAPGTATRDVVRGRFGPLAPTAEMGQGFGLGFAVRNDAGRNPLPGSVGDYYWGGAHGTYFWVDPAEQMYVILMMQSPQMRLPYRLLLRQYAYQALQ